MSEQIRAAFHRNLQSRGIPSDLFQRDDSGAYEFATVEHDWSVWQAAIAASVASPAAPASPVVPRFIGWRTSDYRMETTDKKLADNWASHYDLLPIFEGDPNTSLAAPASPVVPIDMVLFCPACGLQHIDEPEEGVGVALKGGELFWDNPPHRSHLCHGCGHVWRPADVPTNGVAAVKTKGEKDSPAAPASIRQGWDVEDLLSKRAPVVQVPAPTKWLRCEFCHQLGCAAPASPSVAQAEPSERAASLVTSEPEPMFYGRWHHGNGNLCCGSMRYFRADFDTNPAPDVSEGIFDWVCTTMNAALDRWREQKRAADRASAGEAQC